MHHRATQNGWFLHELVGEQFHKAVMGQSHELGFLAHQFVFSETAFYDPQGMEEFVAGRNEAVMFIIAGTVHVMGSGIEEHDIWILV